MNAFTQENRPNKLIVTKFIRDTLPMFNNKVFLDFIDKISSRIDNKNKKDRKSKELQTHNNIYDHIWWKHPSRECKMASFSSTGKTQKL